MANRLLPISSNELNWNDEMQSTLNALFRVRTCIVELLNDFWFDLRAAIIAIEPQKAAPLKEQEKVQSL